MSYPRAVLGGDQRTLTITWRDCFRVIDIEELWRVIPLVLYRSICLHFSAAYLLIARHCPPADGQGQHPILIPNFLHVCGHPACWSIAVLQSMSVRREVWLNNGFTRWRVLALKTRNSAFARSGVKPEGRSSQSGDIERGSYLLVPNHWYRNQCECHYRHQRRGIRTESMRTMTHNRRSTLSTASF